jgi:hypothetical protein
MRSAPRALAPSHPLHVMPSRITRNSHRPRASDRTMVAFEATSSLVALSNSMASSPSAEKLTRMDNKPNFSREVKLQWAGCRETISLSGQSGAFFLTFLFIELIDLPRVSEESKTALAPAAATIPPTWPTFFCKSLTSFRNSLSSRISAALACSTVHKPRICLLMESRTRAWKSGGVKFQG